MPAQLQQIMGAQIMPQPMQMPEFSHEHAHQNGGMPMYYGQMQGEEYGHFQQFSPQQGGYYPYPPPFQHYPQHYQGPPPPQQYYQQHALPQHQMMQQPAPQPPTESTGEAAVELIPLVSDMTSSETAVTPEERVSPAAVPFQQPVYAPYPPQQFAPQDFAYGSPPSQNTPLGPDGAPLRQASFGQGGFPAPAPGATPFYAKGGSNPRHPVRPSPSTSNVPLKSNGMRSRFTPGDGTYRPRPSCSFFEANRCRNRDTCSFPHVLADGQDARTLGRGMMGIDGRTEGPEERGGMPPTYVKGYRGGNNSGMGPAGRAIMNGGYSSKEPRVRRFEESPVAVEGAVVAVTEGVAAQAGADAATALVASVNGAPIRQSNFGTAPSLVAAINGLTRRTPPVAAAAAAVATSQRVPSGADFPALSTPSSPPASESMGEPILAVPAITLAAVLAAQAPTPVVPAPVIEASVPIESPTSPKALGDDFVLVSHADAPVALATPAATPAAVVEAAPVAPAPAPVVPAPRVMLSFASAAARGAAVPAAVVPKRVVAPVAPVVVAVVVPKVLEDEAAKDNKGFKDVHTKKKGKNLKPPTAVPIAA